MQHHVGVPRSRLYVLGHFVFRSRGRLETVAQRTHILSVLRSYKRQAMNTHPFTHLCGFLVHDKCRNDSHNFR